MKYLILLCLIPINSYSVFQQIYTGYKNSEKVKSLRIGAEIDTIETDYQKAKYDWQLELSSQYSDSFLQSLFSFQSNQTMKSTVSLGLKKQTFKYGSFGISHGRIDYDLSKWSNSGLSSFSADKVYEVRNSMTYSYDFLKTPLKSEWLAIAAQEKANNLDNQIELEQDSLTFFQAYLDTKLRVVLNRLHEEFEKRAQKRVHLISKRVKDGLSRLVELNQAKISLLTQKDTTLKNKTLMKEKIYLLENIIGYQIPESSYRDIEWKFRSIEQYGEIREKKVYLELERLEYLNAVLEANLDRVKEESSHSLAINLSYTKNAVNESRSAAMSNSFGKGKNDEKIVSLTYSVPFGEGKSNASEKKLLLQKRKNSIEHKNLEGDFKAKETALNDNIATYENAIKLAQEKVHIAMDTISETQRLYFRGRVSFEDYLRSEESFLNAKLSLVNSISLYENSIVQLAYLNGQLDKFLAQYMD